MDLTAKIRTYRELYQNLPLCRSRRSGPSFNVVLRTPTSLASSRYLCNCLLKVILLHGLTIHDSQNASCNLGVEVASTNGSKPFILPKVRSYVAELRNFELRSMKNHSCRTRTVSYSPPSTRWTLQQQSPLCRQRVPPQPASNTPHPPSPIAPTSDPSIVVSLHEVILEGDIKYQCLSYTWHGPKYCDEGEY
jgi:hypothetical protein